MLLVVPRRRVELPRNTNVAEETRNWMFFVPVPLGVVDAEAVPQGGAAALEEAAALGGTGSFLLNQLPWVWANIVPHYDAAPFMHDAPASSNAAALPYGTASASTTVVPCGTVTRKSSAAPSPAALMFLGNSILPLRHY
ncbi:hypothetical protein PIB30_088532 [Stylosanthes scabra]|uniref:Uncharacterized protein n=1 Tax=Stylosanthes scabra TaxID=79078 RepID=A0ABU6VTW4_9FABA|nr:hypothetical protein [Stylosanthes scabra]